ncbi:MAG: hypothetical protein WCG73_02400, partial [Candidatus Moraniibacteriota bacterium]
VAAGLGTAVAVEAGLEKFADSRRTSKAEKEVQEQLARLYTDQDEAETHESDDEKQARYLSNLDENLKKDIDLLDVKLQSEKRAKTWRKLGSVGIGSLVGSGWMTQFAMDHLGGHVAVDWVKDHVSSVFGGSHGTPVPEAGHVTTSKPSLGQLRSIHPLTPEGGSVGNTPLHPASSPLSGASSVVGVETARPGVPGASAAGPGVANPEQLGGSSTTGVTEAIAGQQPDVNKPSVPTSETLVPEVSAEVKMGETIEDFVANDMEIEKGDSVWKIAGLLADQLDLKEDAQRTHFIDALKDKFGDVRLKAGETINFSDHGIDEDFVKSALADVKGLTEGQIASIEANDAKIADFAAKNPGVTLTNESVETILNGNSVEVTLGQSTGVIDYSKPSAPIIDRVNAPGETLSATSISSEYVVPVEGSPAVEQSTGPNISRIEPVFTAELQPRVNDWYVQIFKMENPAPGQDWFVDKGKIGSMKLMDMMKDAKLYKEGSLTGYKTGLSGEQIKNFAAFFQNVERYEIVFDRKAFFQEHPHATVMDYLKKVAPLVTKGQRLGLYTTTY